MFSEFEPAGHVLWEAQAYGCIVIGYDAFGISEAVENNITGILLKTREPLLVAQEIKKLYQDGAVLSRMQKAAVKNYEKNGTWAGVCAKIYENLNS
jgi:glycosyltransferase involved in cell wall biosynthesis